MGDIFHAGDAPLLHTRRNAFVPSTANSTLVQALTKTYHLRAPLQRKHQLATLLCVCNSRTLRNDAYGTRS